LLTSLGMDDMIARTPEEYVEKSVAFLSDPHRIEHTKKRLQTLRTSAPLYDGTVFARDFERALTRAANLSRDGKAPEDVNFDANSMNSV
jgi:predicted O-linked N-acetylglucosamine transferase (SPINDLY family)